MTPDIYIISLALGGRRIRLVITDRCLTGIRERTVIVVARSRSHGHCQVTVAAFSQKWLEIGIRDSVPALSPRTGGRRRQSPITQQAAHTLGASMTSNMVSGGGRATTATTALNSTRQTRASGPVVSRSRLAASLLTQRDLRGAGIGWLAASSWVPC